MSREDVATRRGQSPSLHQFRVLCNRQAAGASYALADRRRWKPRDSAFRGAIQDGLPRRRFICSAHTAKPRSRSRDQAVGLSPPGPSGCWFRRAGPPRRSRAGKEVRITGASRRGDPGRPGFTASPAGIARFRPHTGVCSGEGHHRPLQRPTPRRGRPVRMGFSGAGGRSMSSPPRRNCRRRLPGSVRAGTCRGLRRALRGRPGGSRVP